jgi:septin 2
MHVTFLTLHRFIFFRLKPLDIKVMKALHHKVNIVPIIAKADTLTLNEVKSLKQKVM